jgi:hypothetical protein
MTAEEGKNSRNKCGKRLNKIVKVVVRLYYSVHKVTKNTKGIIIIFGFILFNSFS